MHALTNDIHSVINGGTNETEIEDLLDIDGVTETVVLGIVLGHPKHNVKVNNTKVLATDNL